MDSTDQPLPDTNKGHRLFSMKEIIMIGVAMLVCVASSYTLYKLMFDENVMCHFNQDVMCHFNQGTTESQPVIKSPKSKSKNLDGFENSWMVSAAPNSSD